MRWVLVDCRVDAAECARSDPKQHVENADDSEGYLPHRGACRFMIEDTAAHLARAHGSSPPSIKAGAATASKSIRAVSTW